MFEKAVPEALKKFLEFCKKPPTQDILHSSVYGLGVISTRLSRESFLEVKGVILEILSSIITANDAFSEKKAKLTDNAVSALGKIALFHSSPDDKLSEEILTKFLSMLPLTHDEEEAQTIHKLLLQETLKRNDCLVSSGKTIQDALLQAISNIQKAVSSNPEAELLDDEGTNLLNQVLSSV